MIFTTSHSKTASTIHATNDKGHLLNIAVYIGGMMEITSSDNFLLTRSEYQDLLQRVDWEMVDQNWLSHE